MSLNLSKKEKDRISNIIKCGNRAFELLFVDNKQFTDSIAKTISEKNEDVVTAFKNDIKESIYPIYEEVSEYMDYDTFFQFSLMKQKDLAIYYLYAIGKIKLF